MSKELSKVNISTPELIELSKNKLEKLSKNKNYPKKVIDIGSRVYENFDALGTVTLEITPELSKRLAKGELRRTNGILRHKDGSIYKHLKEANPTKLKTLSKSINIAFAGLAILEDHLIDEKLNELIDITTRIEGKIDAQNRGKYKSAMDQFRELSTYTNIGNAKNRVPNVLDKLSESQHIYDDLYRKKWLEYNKLNTRYQILKKSKLKISNKNVVDKMNKTANELIDVFCLIMSCITSYVTLKYYLEDDQASAQLKSYEMIEYAKSQIDLFEKEFGPDAINEIKKNYKRVISKNAWKESHLESLENNMKQISATSNVLFNQLIMADLAAFPEFEEKEEIPIWKKNIK